MNELQLMTYRVMEKISGYNISDDFEIDESLVRDFIINTRSTVLKEFYAQHRQVPRSIYVEVPNIEVKKLRPDSTTTRERYVQLPSPLDEGIDTLNVLYFGPNDEYNNMPRVSHGALQSWRHSEFGGKETVYSIVGDRAILVFNSEKGLKFVNAICVFSRPVEIDGVEHFPIPESLAVKLELLVVKDILSTFNVRVDDVNNASDETRKVAVAQKDNGNSR